MNVRKWSTAALALLALAAAPQPAETPKGRLDAPPSAAKPPAPAPNELELDWSKEPARGLNQGRHGDASGFQYQTPTPTTAAGVDPNTGKMPERKIQGLRIGTTVDDKERLGPRAR